MLDQFLSKLESIYAQIHANFFIELTVFMGALALFRQQLKAMILGACKLFYKLLVKPKEIIDFFDSVAEGMKTLEKVGKEFKNNGGSSLRDAIDSIRKNQIIGQQRIYALIDQNNLAYFETDDKGACTFVSKEWSNITGIALDKALGHGWRNGLAEHDLVRVTEGFAKAVADKREFEMTYELSDRDGTKTKVHGHSYVVRAPSGDVLGFLGTITPVK